MSRLSILIYHRVLPVPDPLLPDLPDVRVFRRQMALLRRLFCVLPLSHAVELLRRRALPQRSVCITFDDGYADNAEFALPILQSLGLPACFFIATRFMDGGQMWNDDLIEHVRNARGPHLDLSRFGWGKLAINSLAARRAAIDCLIQRLKYQSLAERQAIASELAPTIGRPLMMTSTQIRTLKQAGMDIGAHTDSHPILRTQSDSDAYADIARGKDKLESLLDAPVSLFAYPNGKPGKDYDQRHVAMVRSLGFRAAVSTAAGAAGHAADLYQLPRFTPWERDSARFLLRLVQNRYRLRA